MIKKRNKIKFLITIIIIINIIIIIPTLYCKYEINKKNSEETILYDKFITVNNRKVFLITDIANFKKQINNSDKYKIDIDSENKITYTNEIDIHIDIDNEEEIENIKVMINDKEYKITEHNEIIKYNANEGKNELSIILYKDNDLIKKIEETIYVISPYKSQFADKITNNGIQVQYGYQEGKNDEKFEYSYPLLKVLGINLIRIDLKNSIETNKTRMEQYKKLIDTITNDNIEVIGIMQTIDGGEDHIINNNTEINEYAKIYKKIEANLPKINFFEIINEENMFHSYRSGAYLNDSDIGWYSNVLVRLKEENKDRNIIPGGTATTNGNYTDNDKRIKSESFYKKLYSNENKYLNVITYHPYSKGNENILNEKITSHKNLENELGGFIYLYATEFGNIENKDQAKKNVRDSVILENYNEIKILYNLWVTDSAVNSDERYGIITNDYKPKDSYYAMKKYYENTNGSEYIGQINLADGLEAHVYDKDGKTKIIVWATDSSKPVSINYNGFTASDLYGNAIENSDGKLEITDSPVYLDNVSTNYFYQAISNSITDGYTDFSTKFKDEIANVNGLSNKISNLNQAATNFKTISSLDENTANSLMKQHFELGNDLINAYNNGSLKIEYVKLSSMLDSLNTIGNSFEDLITVSAKTRITDLTEITNEVNEANSIIENNEKIDIVYPEKIYKFSKDLLDTSSYVLGLEEENDIKTGLINSKATHAKYLANWSKEFSEIYIKDKLNEPISKILNDNEKVINDTGIKVILNNDISNSYTTLKNNLNGLLNYSDNNLDKLNNVYNSQMEFAKNIVNCYNSKTITIDGNQYKTLIESLVNISDDYKDLYKLYVTEDNLSNKEAEDKINNIINRYNDNIDIDLSKETDLINKLKELYGSLSSNDDITLNYLNKQRISKTCEIVSLMLENDIKNVANSECRKITITSDSGLGNYTNHDEAITINLPKKAKVISDNGASSFIFTENGTKEIKINNRGYDYTYRIVVSNINKQAPEIKTNSGQDVKIDVSEDNLKEIKIEKDGEETKAKIGQVISVPGIYKITATDKAGNSSNKEIIVYKNYTNEQNSQIKYITIKSKTKVKDVRENNNYSITKNSKIISALKSANSNGNNIDDAYISTGDVLKDGDNEYTFVVIGDLSGKGQVNASDIIRLRKNIVGITDLSKIQELAADTNLDGKVDILDLLKERKIMVEK